MRLMPPVFVVGSPRSGTTWLYHLLLSAGGFAIYRAEVLAYSVLAPFGGHLRSAYGRKRLLKYWIPSEHFQRTGLDANEVASAVASDCRSAGDLQRIVMDGIARTQGALRWADCTPENVLMMKQIRADFPEALFLHIVRDGRDVAPSLAKQAWIKPLPGDKHRPLLPAAAYWDWVVGHGMSSGSVLGASYLQVRYEDLVAHPSRTLKAISRFIGQTLDLDRIQRASIGSVSKPNSSFKDPKAASSSPVGRWREILAPQEVELLDGMIGARLGQLNPGFHANCRARVRRAMRRRRMAYQARFAARFWVRHNTRTGGQLVDMSPLRELSPPEGQDWTLRPQEHSDRIRSLVHV